jgi:hypothetical protein
MNADSFQRKEYMLRVVGKTFVAGAVFVREAESVCGGCMASVTLCADSQVDAPPCELGCYKTRPRSAIVYRFTQRGAIDYPKAIKSLLPGITEDVLEAYRCPSTQRAKVTEH